MINLSTLDFLKNVNVLEELKKPIDSLFALFSEKTKPQEVKTKPTIQELPKPEFPEFAPPAEDILRLEKFIGATKAEEKKKIYKTLSVETRNVIHSFRKTKGDVFLKDLFKTLHENAMAGLSDARDEEKMHYIGEYLENGGPLDGALFKLLASVSESRRHHLQILVRARRVLRYGNESLDEYRQLVKLYPEIEKDFQIIRLKLSKGCRMDFSQLIEGLPEEEKKRYVKFRSLLDDDRCFKKKYYRAFYNNPTRTIKILKLVKLLGKKGEHSLKFEEILETLPEEDRNKLYGFSCVYSKKRLPILEKMLIPKLRFDPVIKDTEKNNRHLKANNRPF